MRKLTDLERHELDTDVTEEEIIQAIGFMKIGKALGWMALLLNFIDVSKNLYRN